MKEERQEGPLSPWAEVETTCLCSSVRKVARAMTQVYDEALQPSGLRATQFNVLVALALTSTISLTQLAEALVMDRTTLARNLKPLESQGLLVIDTGTDRRVRLLRLTDHGRHALTEALPYWHQAQEHVTTCLGQELSRALLEELNAAMKLASSQ